MRLAIASLSILLLLAPEISAQTNADWRSVELLYQGTNVLVNLDGERPVKGTVEGVSDDELRINTPDRKNHRVIRTRTISRPTVVRVVWIPSGTPSGRKLLIGMIVGGMLGAGVGARAIEHVQDGKAQAIGLGALIGLCIGGLVAAGGPQPLGTPRATVIYKRPRQP